jgi:TPR repeat protein
VKMTTPATTVGEEAYRLYCKSRCGHQEQSFEEFENKCSNTVDARAQLVWQGYYANALYYSQNNKTAKRKGIEMCKLIFPAIKTALDEEPSCPHLQYMLGWCYHNNLGVSKNFDEAVRLFRLASSQGLAIAQSNLGICYDEGEGVPPDRVEGAKLYRLAANSGHAPAQYNLGLSFYYRNEHSQSHVEAVKLFRRAADQGFSPGQLMLGECYDRGNGVQHDVQEAVRLYKLAAEQGNSGAQLSLSQCYIYGNGVFQDLVEAKKTGKESKGEWL